jgi:hypothetical protein
VGIVDEDRAGKLSDVSISEIILHTCIFFMVEVLAGIIIVMLTSRTGSNIRLELWARTPRAEPATSLICSSLFGESSSPGSSLSNHNNNHSSLLSLWNLKIMKDNYSTCACCPLL